jgi:hypothetical protein
VRSLINQTKNSVESKAKRLDQTVDRLLGVEEKLDVLEHSYKDK